MHIRQPITHLEVSVDLLNLGGPEVFGNTEKRIPVDGLFEALHVDGSGFRDQTNRRLVSNVLT